MNLFFDIETRPSKQLPNIEDVKVDKRLKDPEKILKAQQEGQLEQWYEQALDAKKGEILCITARIKSGKELVGENVSLQKVDETVTEREVLYGLDYLLGNTGKHHDYNWIGHNIKGFDLPWIYQKSMKYGFRNILAALPTQKFAKNIFDTMDMWNPWDYRTFVKLDELAEFFGIEGKSMTMEQVKEIWTNPSDAGYTQISNYCTDDVDIVEQVYNKMK